MFMRSATADIAKTLHFSGYFRNSPSFLVTRYPTFVSRRTRQNVFAWDAFSPVRGSERMSNKIGRFEILSELSRFGDRNDL